MKNQTPKTETKKLKKTNMTNDEKLWRETQADNQEKAEDYYITMSQANFK